MTWGALAPARRCPRGQAARADRRKGVRMIYTSYLAPLLPCIVRCAFTLLPIVIDRNPLFPSGQSLLYRVHRSTKQIVGTPLLESPKWRFAAVPGRSKAALARPPPSS